MTNLVPSNRVGWRSHGDGFVLTIDGEIVGALINRDEREAERMAHWLRWSLESIMEKVSTSASN